MLAVMMCAASEGLSLSERSSRHVGANAFASELMARRAAAERAGLADDLTISRLERAVLGQPGQYPFVHALGALQAIFLGPHAAAAAASAGSAAADDRAHLLLYYLWDSECACDWKVRLDGHMDAGEDGGGGVGGMLLACAESPRAWLKQGH